MSSSIPLSGEIVVLLHGILRTKFSMQLIEKALIQQGFTVLNIDYPSRNKNLRETAQGIFPHFQHLTNQSQVTLHFVTHSLGGLIVRTLLNDYPIQNVGRVVMLGPPNHGSELADLLQNNFLYKKWYGPAGQQLTTAYSKNYPPLRNGELGIIAGNRCIDPISYFLLSGVHDGKVTLKSTQLDTMKDHIVLPASHTFMVYNKQVIYQVVYFLKHGNFDKL